MFNYQQINGKLICIFLGAVTAQKIALWSPSNADKSILLATPNNFIDISKYWVLLIILVKNHAGVNQTFLRYLSTEASSWTNQKRQVR